jgi:hypothetical protein
MIGTGAGVALLAILMSGCGGPTVEEQYKPAAGVTPDCSKYTIERNELKCLRDQSRH